MISEHGRQARPGPQLRSDGTLGPPVGTYGQTLEGVHDPRARATMTRGECLRFLRTLRIAPRFREEVAALLREPCRD